MKNKYPLSKFQEEILRKCLLNQNDAAYNISAMIEIRGYISTQKISMGLEKVIYQYPTLRLTIHLGQDNEYYQTVSESLAYEVKKITREKLTDALEKEAVIPITYLDAPLSRIKIWVVSELYYVIQITLSHVIADRYTLDLLQKSLWNILTADNPALAKPEKYQFYDKLPYKIYSSRSQEIAKALFYWKSKLKNFKTYDYLPLDYPRVTDKVLIGSEATRLISDAKYHAIKKYCRENKIRPYIYFLVTLFILFRHISRNNELAIATAVSTRDNNEYNLAGPFVNTLLLRTCLNSESKLFEIFKKINALVSDALQNIKPSFGQIIREIETDGLAPHIFQCMMVYQNSDFSMFENNSLSMRLALVNNSTAKFDLNLYIFDNNESSFNLKLEYASSHFQKNTIDIFLNYFLSTAYSLSQFDAHNYLKNFEKINILAKPCANKQCALHKNDIKPISYYINKALKTYPNRVAIKYKNIIISYQELSLQANQAERMLTNFGVLQGDVIGVYTSRRPELISLLIAIFRRGAVYLPIESDFSLERTQDILANAEPKMIITFNDNFPLNYKKVIKFNDRKDDYIKQEPNAPLDKLSKISYLIYTSGTTGKSKGVAVTEEAIVNRILWMRDHLDVTEHDVIMHKTSLMFDVSIWELLLPLFTGATMVIVPTGDNKNPDRLANLINQHNITIAHFVPIFLDASINILEKRKVDDTLKHIVCSGDTLKPSTIHKFNKSLPKAILHNYYGPTEATIDVTFYTVQENKNYRITPIGRPIWNTEVFICDDDEHVITECFIPGQLYISGICLAAGYYKNPAMTADKFIQLKIPDRGKVRAYKSGDKVMRNADGNIIYLGRIDRQIKIRGIRIECEEIEHYLEMYNGIDLAKVVKRIVDDGEFLIAYIKISKNSQINSVEINRYLAKKYSSGALPNHFVFLEEIPTFPSGKINFSKFPDFDIREKSINYEGLSLIDKIKLAMQEVLVAKDIAYSDNYFNLGGDSIKSIQLVTRLRELGIDVTVNDILKHPIIADLHGAVHQKKQSEGQEFFYKPKELLSRSDRIRAFHEKYDDVFPLSALQKLLYFKSQTDESYRVYVTTFKIKGVFDLNSWNKAINTVSTYNSIMRACIDLENFETPMMVIYPRFKHLISYNDISSFHDKSNFINSFIQSEKKNPFEWTNLSLFRFHIHKISNDLIQFSITEPILDGWSVSIICSEIFKNYQDIINKNKVIQNKKYAELGALVKQENAVINSEEYKIFWQRELSKAVPTVLLDVKEQLNVKDHCRVAHIFTKEQTEKIQKLANNMQVPIKTVLLAVHIKVLHNITKKKSLCTGLMSNIRPEYKDAEKIASIYLNVLPLIVSDATLPFENLIKELISLEIKINKYRQLPYAKIIENNNLKFDTVFNFTNFHAYDSVSCKTNFEILEMFGTDQTFFNVTMQFTILPIEKCLRLAIDFNGLNESCSLPKKILSNYLDLILKFIY